LWSPSLAFLTIRVRSWRALRLIVAASLFGIGGAVKSTSDHQQTRTAQPQLDLSALAAIEAAIERWFNMAPILASATGVAPVAIEDPALRELHGKLCTLPSKFTNITDLCALANLVEPFSLSWPFDEQVFLK
jgi:hypothetical protein